MRVIGGRLKGRKINAPKQLPVRPTTDFAKEALFNVLNHRLEFDRLNVLDLFAGTANISLEFLSRGAKCCTSIDQHYGCIKFMNKLKHEHELTNWQIRKGNAFHVLRQLNAKYDLIFADPPYNLDSLETLPELIFDLELLKEDGLFILEHSKHSSFNQHAQFEECKKYGNVNFTFFRGFKT